MSRQQFFDGNTGYAKIVAMTSQFRSLPSVDRLLAEDAIKELAAIYPRDLIINLVRQTLETERSAIAKSKTPASLDRIVASITNELDRIGSVSLRPVINATGVILHTNLGRAPLSHDAMQAIDSIAGRYCNLEFDVDSGERGWRDTHVESLICRLTGAGAALVVNNNAAAVLLALTVLAKRKEVIVSRGESVEIGGGFRITEVMRQSGARLVEIGATNCTYVNDYEEAITPGTAALLRVHSSNFRVVGFTHSVALDELVALGDKNNLPVIDNLGSGCFLDTTVFGLDPEPLVTRSIAAGAKLVCFSGDKLVGGPQAGIIVGSQELIARLKKHPLDRALRLDKIRLAGMAATLIHYLKGEALEKVPIWMMISTGIEQIDRRARKWAEALGGMARVVDGESMVGGGSLPGGTLPTRLVAIGGGGKKSRYRVHVLAQRLRQHDPPVVGRINEDVLLLDPRTVLPDEDKAVIDALRRLTA
ncbi:MAG: L-seryl-tRNA(Sec) selenium transferase [Dehalococcoidales bacterium]|nr:L-seryl-tRNA(Sec) selenium transferase [Dehalococcoidales bacterium]